MAPLKIRITRTGLHLSFLLVGHLSLSGTNNRATLTLAHLSVEPRERSVLAVKLVK